MQHCLWVTHTLNLWNTTSKEELSTPIHHFMTPEYKYKFFHFWYRLFLLIPPNSGNIGNFYILQHSLKLLVLDKRNIIFYMPRSFKMPVFIKLQYKTCEIRIQVLYFLDHTNGIPRESTQS